MDKKTIFINIKKLVTYGIERSLIEEEDRYYTVNRLLAEFKLDSWEEPEEIFSNINLPETLKTMCDFAVSTGIIEEGIVSRDLFDTELIGIMTARPSSVIKQFKENYSVSPVKATDEFYKMCMDVNYIRRDRIARDLKWVTKTKYGDIDITINLSKPEKDPRAIIAAKNAVSGYPKCMLCPENEGYAGRMNFPARQNLRIIPITLGGQPWGFQYSPYVYYNEHCIVFKKTHTPMAVTDKTFEYLFDFVKLFPHYFIGSNGDLPIVGGSILAHEHYQGGNYEFAMAKAPIDIDVSFKGYENIEAGIVKWPMSVIRLRSEETENLIKLAAKILTAWRAYTDEKAVIFAHTDGEPHNTITPIARFSKNKFELDLVLRNNYVTKEHPLGLYHPHAELHHIKEENIGLIEVMGLAVLPPRLKTEMKKVADTILSNGDLRADPDTRKHADWAEEIIPKYQHIDADNIDDIIKKEIGSVFTRVLEDAGVYKRTPEGIKAFLRFIDSLN